MDWQQPVALLIVAAAAGLLLRSRWRRRQFSLSSEGTCGGCSNGSTPSGRQGSIVFRARKGQRAEVRVKMG
jgi:hypothetical protein